MEKKLENKNEVIEFTLANIDILKFNLNEIDKDIQKSEIDVGLEIKGEYKEEIEAVETIITVKIFKKERKNKIIGDLKVKYTFELFGADILKEGEDFALPRHLITGFNIISVSTTRGILFTKFQGTKLHDFILPLIDPKELNNAIQPVD